MANCLKPFSESDYLAFAGASKEALIAYTDTFAVLVDKCICQVFDHDDNVWSITGKDHGAAKVFANLVITTHNHPNEFMELL